MAYYTEATSEVFNAIMSAASGVTTLMTKNAKNTSGYLSRSSITKAAKDLVMSFPVICPDTVSPTTAAMIVKAIERNCVTTLQLLFSAANLRGDNGLEVINKWHKNMDDSFDIDDYLDYLDTMVAASESADDALLRAATKYTREMLQEMAANYKLYPLSDFSERPLNRFTVSEGYAGIVSVMESTEIVTEVKKNMDMFGHEREYLMNPYYFDGANSKGVPFDDPDQIRIQIAYDDYLLKLKNYNELKDFHQWQAENSEKEMALKKKQLDRAMKDFELNKKQFNYQKWKDDVDRHYREARDKADDAYRSKRDSIKDQLDQANLALSRAKTNSQLRRDEMQRQVDQTNLFHQQLLSSDVRKCNELVPSMMIIKFYADAGDGHYEAQQFIAGVKARLVSCPSMEIIDAVRATERNKVNLTNLIRATTKEISFCRDFIAAIDQAKIDAKRNSTASKTSPIWRSLQWRSSKSVMNRLLKRKPNDAGAITTLVLTSEEVNYMKSEYNIDLNVPNKVKSIMEEYNLMCFCIVDEEVEVVRFLFDGEKYFQDYAFSALEKETGDSSYKKVVNLMSKISR